MTGRTPIQGWDQVAQGHWDSLSDAGKADALRSFALRSGGAFNNGDSHLLAAADAIEHLAGKVRILLAEQARHMEVLRVAELIHGRWAEGSLQADIAEDCRDQGLVPIQDQLARALGLIA